MLNPGLKLKIHGSMATTLLLGFIALTLVFVWMLLVRYRIGVLEDWLEANELDLALTERRSEGGGQFEKAPVDRGAVDGPSTDRVVVA